MVESCDVGSLPFVGDLKRFSEGASSYGHLVNDSTVFFEKMTVHGLLDKAGAGIEVPNYPQYRDMARMFFDMLDGVEKVDGGYIEMDALAAKDGNGTIPEVQAIENNCRRINERLGKPFKLRICVTGPYTLSSLFIHKDQETFTRLGKPLAEIAGKNVFCNKHGGVVLVAIDEPVFGLVDDPLLDRGCEARENLLRAWQTIMQTIASKGAKPCLHLHNTSNELFWEVDSLKVIEPPTQDLLYQTERTKERLEATDKFLKASIGVTDFDQLIRNGVTATSKQNMNKTNICESVAEVWKGLADGRFDPTAFLEDIKLMKNRLVQAVQRFGTERVPYAGPECGLRSFPTYDCAIESLRRVSNAIKTATRQAQPPPTPSE